MTEAAYAGTSGAGLSTDIPATADNDAAVASLGGNRRMPTTAEFKELTDNCDWTWKQLNGVYGFEVKSKAPGNTNSIFLPAAGDIKDGTLIEVGSIGYCWSSSQEDEGFAFSLYFDEEQTEAEYSTARYIGLPIRPVLPSL